MKIHVVSDLHEDHNAPLVGPYRIPEDVEADVVVVPGDVGGRLSRMGLRWLEDAFRGTPIVAVAGNHDYWRGDLGLENGRFRDRLRTAGIHLLDETAVVIGGTRFLGCTLWTDYAAWHDDVYRAQAEAMKYMNDHAFIRTERYARRLKAYHLAETHDRHRDFIEQTLSIPFDGPSVVVTHHPPSVRSLEFGRVTEPLDGAYASRLEPLIERMRPNLWIHGHTHVSRDYFVGQTRVLSNPRGYMQVLGLGKTARIVPENANFDPRLVVDVRARPEHADRHDRDAEPSAAEVDEREVERLCRLFVEFYRRPAYCGVEMSRSLAEERALWHARAAWASRRDPLQFETEGRDPEDLALERLARRIIGLTTIPEERAKEEASGPLLIERRARDLRAAAPDGDLDEEAFDALRRDDDYFGDEPDDPEIDLGVGRKP